MAPIDIKEYKLNLYYREKSPNTFVQEMREKFGSLLEDFFLK